ncbi:Protein mlc [Nocardiopsis dassonvillei]|uniref:ROK family protein n=1 Tax=Nocardiopsis dassonvillei TaxID=2014 RepID=UPI003F56635B
MSSDQYGSRLTVQQAQDQIDRSQHLSYRSHAKKKGVTTRNLERVFSTIVTVQRPSTRDIAKLLGLSPSTVSGLVKHLEDRQMVRTAPGRGASQGRRPKPVLVDDRTRHTIGFEVTAEKVVGVAMNLAGRVVLLQVADLGPEAWTKDGWVNADRVVDTIRDLFISLKRQLLERIRDHHPDALEQSIDPVVGIGVSLGGHINRHTGEVLFSPDLRWGTPRRRRDKRGPTVPLSQRVRDVTGVDNIVVDNDAHGRAAAYQLYGGGACFNNAPFTVVLVTEVGIGAAQFIDHELYRGASGKSLELGNTLAKPDGRPCRCGDKGCLEAMATRDAVLENSKAHSLGEARKLADEGDERAIRAWTQAGSYLGTGLSVLVDLLDTSRIVLTGPAIARIGESAPVVFDPRYDRAMREALQEHVYGSGIDPGHVEVVEETGEWNGARGAAALVVHDMITGHLDL